MKTRKDILEYIENNKKAFKECHERLIPYYLDNDTSLTANLLKPSANFDNRMDFVLPLCLEIMTEEQKNLLFNNKDFAEKMYINGELSYMLTPVEVKTIIKKAKEYLNINVDCIQCFTCVEDFDNITDEELEIILDMPTPPVKEFTKIFGDKYLKALIEDDENVYKLRFEEDEDFVLKQLIKRPEPLDLVKLHYTRFEWQDYINLIKKHHGYLKHLPYIINHERTIVNRVWNDSDLDEIIRYLTIVCQCCINKDIPDYQLKRLKDLAGVIRINNFNWDACYGAIMDRYTKTGQIALEEPKNKKAAPRWALLFDNKYEIFDTEKELNDVVKKHLKKNPDFTYIKTKITN